MSLKFTRFAGLALAVVVSAGGLLAATTVEAALPPNAAPAGVATVSPVSGSRTSTFGLTLPAAAACAGDTATGGYRWSTFMVANSVDASQLTWVGGPPSYAAAPSAVVQPLYSVNTGVVDQNTAVGNGAVLVAGVPFDLGVFPANFVPAGRYKIGVACVLAGATESYWQSTIDIAVNGSGVITTYTLFALPTAPTLSSPLTAGNGSLSGTFTAPAPSPAAVSYLVTATPPSGPVITSTVTAPASSFTIGGLANGTSYSVRVATTNAAGTGPASNAVLGSPVDPNQRPAVTNLAAAPGANSVALSWTTPTGVAPTGYSIAVSPTVAGSPFAAAAGAVAFNVPGLTNGASYTFTVTPTHPAPFFGLAASVSATTGSSFTPLTPARLADTRSGAKVGNAAGTGAPLVVNVLNRGGLPGSGIGAVSLNVTVVDGGLPLVGGGYVTVYPCGTRPNASNLNFDAGQTIPNAVIAPVSATGDVCFYVYGTAHLLVDVSAYFPATT